MAYALTLPLMRQGGGRLWVRSWTSQGGAVFQYRGP